MPTGHRFALPLGVVCLLLAACGQNNGPGTSWATAVEVTDEPDDEPVNPHAFVPDAHRTIAQKMPQFRRCFERLQATGKVYLVLTINRDGSVRRARGEGSVPRDVIHCIEAQAKRAQFSPPEGGELAKLDVPVALYEQ